MYRLQASQKPTVDTNHPPIGFEIVCYVVVAPAHIVFEKPTHLFLHVPQLQLTKHLN